MENRERQILSEIMDMMASIRSQMDILEEKMVQLQQTVGQEDMDMTPIDLDIDGLMDVPDAQAVSDVPQDEPVDTAQEQVEVFDVTVDDEAEQVKVCEETAEVEDELIEVEEEIVEEEIVEDEKAEEELVEVLEEKESEQDDDDDLPFFSEPEPVKPAVKPEPKERLAVIDSMTDRQAWRTDMPGTQVKDIRSAISLNDRILFINMLFAQDPMAFQDALTRINQMASLDEVVDYVAAERPEWDLESETVYRFMMAVRRKIR